MKINSFYFIILLVPYFIFGQVKKGDQYLQSLSYNKAIQYYENTLSKDEDSLAISSKIAKCYSKIGNYKKAIDWYRFIEKRGKLTNDQIIDYALLTKVSQKYIESEKLFSTVSSPSDVAENNQRITEVHEKIKFNDVFKIRKEDFNTNHSEIGASFVNGDIIFSSNKRKNWAMNRLDTWTGSYFYNLYRIDSTRNDKTKTVRIKWKNSKHHDGPGIFCKATSRYYFTRTELTNKSDSTVYDLNLYAGEIIKGKLKNVQALNFNSPNYSLAHPAISQDGKLLFFSSDMPGGYGGMDLYFVRLDDKGNAIGNPINLGEKVNTSRNEVFPYYNTAENVLFFSSNGHFGLGGLDIYSADLDNDYQIKHLDNIGKPINSEFDDLSFYMNEEQTLGFFSTSRNENQDDIYSFTLSKKFQSKGIFEGFIVDLFSNEPLENASIELINSNTTQTFTSDSNGYFSFPLEEIDTEEMRLVLYKDNYLTIKETFEIINTEQNHSAMIKMQPSSIYTYNGNLTDEKTRLPLDDVLVNVVDSKTNKVIQTIKSDKNGQFKPDQPLLYNEKDTLSLLFELQKNGYESKMFVLNQVLSDQKVLRFTTSMRKTSDEDSTLLTNENLISLSPIYYDFDRWTIRKDAEIELLKIVDIMKKYPNLTIELRSHTDSRGDNTYNQSLSIKRMKSAKSYLIKNGIHPNLISGKAYGETQLKISDKEIYSQTKNQQEALHQKNRRTEFRLIIE